MFDVNIFCENWNAWVTKIWKPVYANIFITYCTQLYEHKCIVCYKQSDAYNAINKVMIIVPITLYRKLQNFSNGKGVIESL